jgi:hypothetical protein
MAFHLDTRNTKYLHNHQAALRHHDNITPIRGRSPECRPIAERNKTHFTINKNTHDQTITVRLYNTDIITYYPPDHPTHANQIKVNLGGWNSESTRAAIKAVTRVRITSTDNKAWVRDQDGKYYLVPPEGVWLQVGEGYYNHKVLNPTYPTTHKLNRKAMNEKRKQFAPFIQHMTGLAKLIGHDAAAWQIEFEYPALLDRRFTGMNVKRVFDILKKEQEEGGGGGGGGGERSDAYLVGVAEGSDLEAWSKLAKWLVWSTRKYKWMGYGNGMSGGYKIHFCPERAIKELEKNIIKAYRSEVLTEETITDGRIVRDKYK